MNKTIVPASKPRPLEFRHELVQLDAATPARVFLHGPAEIPFHWHSALEIVAVLRGSVQFEVAGSMCQMGTGDVMIINTDDLHSSGAWTDDAVVYGMHLNAEYFEAAGLPGFSQRKFLCRSFLHGKGFEAITGPIKALIARAILIQLDREDRSMVRRSLADLLALYVYNKVPWEGSRDNEPGPRRSGRRRVLGIMQRVRDNGRAKASLADIAREEDLSISHLSRMFYSYAGIGFRDYSQNVRLDSAASDLKNTRNTVSVILKENGFSNPTHFYTKFFERFACNPATYRKSGRDSSNPDSMRELGQRQIRDLLRRELQHLDDALDVLRISSTIRSESIAVDAPHNMFSNSETTRNDNIGEQN